MKISISMSMLGLLMSLPLLGAGKKEKSEAKKIAKDPEKKEKKAAKEKYRELKLKEQKLAQEVFHATNTFRTKKNLKSLSYNNELAAIAREHSKKMAYQKVPFSHAEFESRIKKLSKPIKSAAENLFKSLSRNSKL